MKVDFFVPGIPAPGGSKRGFYIAALKRVVISDANSKKVMPWRAAVSSAAQTAMGRGQLPMLQAVRLTVTFHMPRPKAHFSTAAGRAAGGIKNWAVTKHPTTKPDTTKLLRALEDALKGIVWGDDSQVVQQNVQKRYANGAAGATVEVEEIGV